ncbi:MAG: hypothetical protein JRI68_08815 [Deltaproteobacteria bacterium]|nr:hypothetical protein [Deltaproteobacteria bacterium]
MGRSSWRMVTVLSTGSEGAGPSHRGCAACINDYRGQLYGGFARANKGGALCCRD